MDEERDYKNFLEGFVGGESCHGLKDAVKKALGDIKKLRQGTNRLLDERDQLIYKIETQRDEIKKLKKDKE